jgi:hypothetical protein
VRPNRLDKARSALAIIVEDRGQRFFALDLDLAIGPARNFHNGVDDRGVVLVWVERNLITSSAIIIFEG